MSFIDCLYYYPYLETCGERQMEYDLKLMERADKGFHLRFYRFSPPTLSLGRLQKIEDFKNISPYPVVKRPTGGRAVLHLGDLVYCVSARNDFLGKKLNLIEFYNLIGEIFLDALQKMGVPAELTFPRERRAYFSKTNCFSSLSQAEISVAGRKMIGSAQYRLQNKVLQHGSILLNNNLVEQEKIFGKNKGEGNAFLFDYLPSPLAISEIINIFKNSFIKRLKPQKIVFSQVMIS